MTNTNKVADFAKVQPKVTMKTHPTLLVDIAFKLGIDRPGADKEKLVAKVNGIIDKYNGVKPEPKVKGRKTRSA